MKYFIQGIVAISASASVLTYMIRDNEKCKIRYQQEKARDSTFKN